MRGQKIIKMWWIKRPDSCRHRLMHSFVMRTTNGVKPLAVNALDGGQGAAPVCWQLCQTGVDL